MKQAHAVPHVHLSTMVIQLQLHIHADSVNRLVELVRIEIHVFNAYRAILPTMGCVCQDALKVSQFIIQI